MIVSMIFSLHVHYFSFIVPILIKIGGISRLFDKVTIHLHVDEEIRETVRHLKNRQDGVDITNSPKKNIDYIDITPTPTVKL